jgi:Phosphotransferase enzyme family
VIEGLAVHCERRRAGWPADRRAFSAGDAARWLDQAATFLAGLGLPGADPLGSGALAMRCGTWRELASQQLRSSTAARSVERLVEQACTRLAGVELRAVVMHGDLRPRHLLVDGRSNVTGFIHWSLGDSAGLPGLDLVHLHLHLEAMRRCETLGAALQRLLAAEDSERPEHQPLWRYSSALGISRNALLSIARLHPLYLASIAGRFGQPPAAGWLAAQLGPLVGSS